MCAKEMGASFGCRWLGLLLCCWLGLVSTAQADDDIFSPMLTLRMGERVIKLEREQIAALPQAKLVTSTTLDPRPVTWEGPLVRDVLTLLGISPEQVVPIRMESWDDYRVDLTNEDFSRWDVILAWRADGKDLTVENLGPLRVTYPRDQHEELQDQRLDHRWVWMLRSITVLP